MARFTHKRSDGFTLVEVLIGLTISAMLLGAIGFAVSAASDQFQSNQAQIDLQHRCRMLLMRLSELTRTTLDQRPGDPNSSTQATEWTNFKSGTGGSVTSKGVIFTQEIPQTDGTLRQVVQQYAYFATEKEVRLRTATNVVSATGATPFADPVVFLENAKPAANAGSWQTVVRGVTGFSAQLYMDTLNVEHRVGLDYLWTQKIIFTLTVNPSLAGVANRYASGIELSGSKPAFSFVMTAEPVGCSWKQSRTGRPISTAVQQQ